MRLRGIRRSSNVEVRGGSGSRRAGGKSSLGVAGVLAVLAIGYFTGIDVSSLLQGGNVQQGTTTSAAADDAATEFSAQVLTTTEAVWGKVFREQLNREYVPPRLVIFNGVTQSPCGDASGATGPFYCPADNKAYLDTQFFTALDRQMGAGGDFAAAYVIAHEVAHHVQNQLGILPKVNAARMKASKTEANALTVRLELMADCLSGIWALNVQGLMERGDLEEALNAARKIGDDHLQRQAGRVPQPHTFTHGTSEQRASWFARGYDSGSVGQCDTFAAARL
ncbi:KPN_02809 family neutral zinc metallopeptidase [Sulfitobacter donghicola]|uniref:Membrane protein n=1 Tax=Sulfitobacter donghicola DSW-25 = KCTC 12864 = JCM 14565 TaxID=1300350 RepID=A0A073IN66_9RHOB|nr:neutral zinc metallopeptidase [Sulfitobacter donghicola]KEJ90931.1 membrane protein [Sulfitobacter donghicola DSW-25 = KCTC 12864 = JCM 14565]